VGIELHVVAPPVAKLQSVCSSWSIAVKLFSSACSLWVKFSNFTTVLLISRSALMELLRSNRLITEIIFVHWDYKLPEANSRLLFISGTTALSNTSTTILPMVKWESKEMSKTYTLTNTTTIQCFVYNCVEMLEH